MGVHRLLLLHASRASVDPVSEYYLREAPEMRPVNILDEGVMGNLRDHDWPRAVSRLRDLIGQAVDVYGVDAALVTCSALGPVEMESIRRDLPVRAVKIDEPMLATAAKLYPRSIGLLATFPATVETSTAWLRHCEPGAKIDIECDAGALELLLQGDRVTHDNRLLAAAEALASRGAGCLVLAQVSMARLAPEIAKRTGLPVLESLTTSLTALRG